MSSVYSPTLYQPAMCIDGRTANQGSDLNICLTQLNQPDPWLSITLPQQSVVSKVVVYGRSDCCNNRFLADFEVWIGDEAGRPGEALGMQKCGRGAADQDRASVNEVSCGGRSGSVVTLLLPGSARTIMLSEMVVIGYLADSVPPGTSPPPTHALNALALWGSSDLHSRGVCITSPAATRVPDGTKIAAQCCTASGACRRRTSASNNDCIAGSLRSPGFLEMAFSEAQAACTTRGLVMCERSCKSEGCFYNEAYVWTGLSCP